MTHPGKSKTITVEPIKHPAPREVPVTPKPEKVPDREPVKV